VKEAPLRGTHSFCMGMSILSASSSPLPYWKGKTRQSTEAGIHV